MILKRRRHAKVEEEKVRVHARFVLSTILNDSRGGGCITREKRDSDIREKSLGCMNEGWLRQGFTRVDESEGLEWFEVTRRLF